MSYSKTNMNFVHKLNRCLIQEGFKICILDNSSEKIKNAITSSRKIISIWSIDYFQEEILWKHFAYLDDYQSNDKKVIAVLIEDCNIPLSFRHLMLIDFRDSKSFNDSIKQLIECLNDTIYDNDFAESINVQKRTINKSKPNDDSNSNSNDKKIKVAKYPYPYPYPYIILISLILLICIVILYDYWSNVDSQKKIIVYEQLCYFSIDSIPQNALVYINGEKIGKTPLFKIPLKNGKNIINLKLKCYKEESIEVHCNENYKFDSKIPSFYTLEKNNECQ